MGRVRNKEEEAKALQEAAQKVITRRLQILKDFESENFLNFEDSSLKYHFSQFLQKIIVILILLLHQVLKYLTLTLTLKNYIP